MKERIGNIEKINNITFINGEVSKRNCSNHKISILNRLIKQNLRNN